MNDECENNQKIIAEVFCSEDLSYRVVEIWIQMISKVMMKV